MDILSTNMNSELLIQLIRSYPVLYDLSHPKYMNNVHKLKIWIEIAKQLNVEASACKARWNNIRDHYRKSLKKTRTRCGKIRKYTKHYKYSEQLNFLKIHFERAAANEDIDVQENKIFKNENISRDNNIVAKEPCISQNNASLSPSSLTSYVTDNFASTSQREASVIDTLHIKDGNQDSTQHSVNAFLAGISPTLKSLSPYYLNLAKSEIFAIVQKYEMKMIMGEYLYQKEPDENLAYKMTSHPDHYSSTLSPISTSSLSSDDTFQREDRDAIYQN